MVMPNGVEQHLQRIATARDHCAHDRVAQVSVGRLAEVGLCRVVAVGKHLRRSGDEGGKSLVLGLAMHVKPRIARIRSTIGARRRMLLAGPRKPPGARLGGHPLGWEDALLHLALAAPAGISRNPRIINLAPTLSLTARETRLVGTVVAVGLIVVGWRHLGGEGGSLTRDAGDSRLIRRDANLEVFG